MLRRERDLAANEIYIGATLFENASVARLVPYAVATPDGWRKVDRDAFPDEGCVFSVDPKVVRKPKDYVVLFTMAVNDKGGGRDRYITTEVDEAVEILHRLEGAAGDELRDVVMRSGVERGAQEDPSVIVPLDATRVAFPRMQRSGPTTWVLSHLEHSDRVPTYARPPGDFDWVAIEGRRFLLPGQLPIEPTGYVNWQTDVEFFQSIVKRIRKISSLRSGTDDFVINDRLAGRLHGLLRDGDIIGEQAGANDAARDRLREFLTKLDREAGAASAIADALFADPAIKGELAKLSAQEIEALRATEIDRMRSGVVAEVEAGLAERRSELTSLAAEVSATSAQLHARTEELARIEGLLATGLESLGSGLGGVMRDIRDAGRTLSEIMALAGVEAPRAEVTGGSNQPEPAPWSVPRRNDAPSIGIEELAERARDVAASCGIDEDSIRRLDILARAGEVPVVVGNAAELLLERYAGLVAGGELVRMPLDPSVLGVEDLWRRGGSTVPTPLATAWNAAIADRSIVRIVCLDDVDRASLSGWFARFGALYRASRPENLLLVATLSPGTRQAPLDAKERGLHPVVTADVGSDALTAALSGAAGDEPQRRRLGGPLLAVPAVAERRSLLAKVVTSGIEGGDVAARLSAIHAAALSWHDSPNSCDFAVEVFAPRSKPAGETGGTVSELHAERKTS
jgi:hypothetical protein